MINPRATWPNAIKRLHDSYVTNTTKLKLEFASDSPGVFWGFYTVNYQNCDNYIELNLNELIPRVKFWSSGIKVAKQSITHPPVGRLNQATIWAATQAEWATAYTPTAAALSSGRIPKSISCPCNPTLTLVFGGSPLQLRCSNDMPYLQQHDCGWVQFKGFWLKSKKCQTSRFFWSPFQKVFVSCQVFSLVL